MDRYITKSKYFSSDFNTAIFSDPIRIYFSNDQESQALELYFKMQSRKNQFEKFLRKRGNDNYCYIMLYSDSQQFQSSFDGREDHVVPGEMGDDFIFGINGPMNSEMVDDFINRVDKEIGYYCTAS